MTTDLFKYQRGQAERLIAAGFQLTADIYTRTQPLLAPIFDLTINIQLPHTVTTQLIDRDTQAPYTLHLAARPTGKFVAQVRQAYLDALQTVADQCFEPDVFQTDSARDLIAYVDHQYHDQLEFLWKNFPTNAVWRRSDTKKWYAAILTVAPDKLGLTGDHPLTVLDLRLEPDALTALVDQQTYFPGYHMNKKHWYTIILDGQVPLAELTERLDHSYQLAH
ncbi:MmcQ/YjbR family DNA-binding protein [Lactiplantibacillus daowaiensis]|uniref:MmcQ/YjbR family DNA-binding protein n=1 Tax=Lactiplantibacillus daowaiensis TaxID=2559918 RepID=A0ABW1RY49_9LACO|nr:MmcQ/YjbR family DNA-binding protein [Lactiplantibacillus daowaiensis]